MSDITVEQIGAEDINFGTGSFSRTARTGSGNVSMSQVKASDIPIEDDAAIIAATDVELALKENRQAVDAVVASIVTAESDIDDLETLTGLTVELTLTNKTGGTVNANDLVAISTANDSAFIDITEDADAQYGVVTATILNNTSGVVRIIGSVSVETTGSVSRGNYIYASGAADKAKARAGRQVGAFGVALADAAANVTTVKLWGNTDPTTTVSTEVQTFTSSDTWTKPSSGGLAIIEVWGGGGGGGGGDGTDGGGAGGGGGAYRKRLMRLADLGATETVTIGAGGTAAAAGGANDGGAGGNTTFGAHVTGYGGGPGIGGNGVGGGGGSIISAASGQVGQPPGSSAAGASKDGFGGGGGGAAGSAGATPAAAGDSGSGGAGGGGGSHSAGGSDGGAGGQSVFGGGGGGGGAFDAVGAGGASLFGGAGGTGGNNSTVRLPGTQPGGGGGGGSANGGNGSGEVGGAGKVVVTVI